MWLQRIESNMDQDTDLPIIHLVKPLYFKENSKHTLASSNTDGNGRTIRWYTVFGGGCRESLNFKPLKKDHLVKIDMKVICKKTSRFGEAILGEHGI